MSIPPKSLAIKQKIKKIFDEATLNLFESCTYENIKSLAKEMIKRKDKWITENDAISILFDFFSDRLKEKKEPSGILKLASVQNLSQLFDDAEQANMMQQIEAKFDSIPQDYTVCFFTSQHYCL